MEKTVLYFLEFLSQIQAVQVSISDNCPKNLSFTKCSVSSHKDDEREAKEGSVLCHWEEPQLRLSSHLALRVIPGEAVHVRFQTERKEPVEEGGGKGASCESGKGGRLPPSSLLGEKLEDGSMTLRCGFCSNRLTRDTNYFKRVLPLPSDHWSEFTGNVFCHTHSHGRGDDVSLSSLLPQPREGDCLVGESILLLRSSALDFDHGVALKPLETGDGAADVRVVCKRCRYGVGSSRVKEGHTPDGGHVTADSASDSVVLQLQRHSIVVENGVEDLANRRVHWLRREEDRLARKLYSTSKDQMSFRYIVQDEQQQPYLFVGWIVFLIILVLLQSLVIVVFVVGQILYFTANQRRKQGNASLGGQREMVEMKENMSYGPVKIQSKTPAEEPLYEKADITQPPGEVHTGPNVAYSHVQS